VENPWILFSVRSRLQSGMPWRKKPARYLHYWTGPVNRTGGFKTVLVYCLGDLPDDKYTRCHHIGRIALADLPDWDWYDISAHLKCTKCGSVGWVDTRLDWSEVINFNKGILG
jgi:hypothetical protein